MYTYKVYSVGYDKITVMDDSTMIPIMNREILLFPFKYIVVIIIITFIY